MRSVPLTRKTPLRAKRDLRRYTGKPKRCACGAEYMPRTMSQEFCSTGCASRFRRPSRKVKRSCAHCAREFEVYPSEIARGWGKFCSRRCAGLASPGSPPAVGQGADHPSFKHGHAVKPKPLVDRRRFKSGQDRCQQPGCRRRARLSEHHVVYEQEVRRRKGDVSDPRDALRLCNSCHASHHHRSRPVPLAALRDENFEFAFGLMGAAAFDYLRRRYSGDDPRVHVWLARIDAAAASSGDSQQEVQDGEGRGDGDRPEGD